MSRLASSRLASSVGLASTPYRLSRAATPPPPLVASPPLRRLCRVPPPHVAWGVARALRQSALPYFFTLFFFFSFFFFSRSFLSFLFSSFILFSFLPCGMPLEPPPEPRRFSPPPRPRVTGAWLLSRSRAARRPACCSGCRPGFGSPLQGSHEADEGGPAALVGSLESFTQVVRHCEDASLDDLRESDSRGAKTDSGKGLGTPFPFFSRVCSLLNKPTAPKNGTHHTAAVKKSSAKQASPPFPPPSLPLPQSPGSQTRNSLHICIVCLALPAISIVVRRSPEWAAASAASWSRSGALSPSTRSVTLSSWLFMRCNRRRLFLATLR